MIMVVMVCLFMVVKNLAMMGRVPLDKGVPLDDGRNGIPFDGGGDGLRSDIWLWMFGFA